MHLPVLKEEVLIGLDPKPNRNFVDCTGGEGGHTLAVAERIGPEGKVLSIDWEQRNVDLINRKTRELGLEGRVRAVKGDYVDLAEIIEKEGFKEVFGIVLDLGFSSWHIDESRRGFSFNKDEPLDMRYDQEGELTAWEIVNSWPPTEIEKILREYGEERFFKQIVQAIIYQRKRKKIDSSLELADLIRRAIPKIKRIDPATKTFQALRIRVNDELNNLITVLPVATEVLEPEGRLAVISFHSLEDRIVKNFFKGEERLKIETKRPIIPKEEEIINNPRSRSAKLRIATKIR